MNAHEPAPDRFLPLGARRGGVGTLIRWAVTLLALVVLIAVAYEAYTWFAGDVVRRQAVAAGEEPDGVPVPPPVEVQGLAQPAGAPDTGPDMAPASPADLGHVSDPDRRRSVCGYLAAESERLNYEFKQPLPPPVIDRIATEIAQVHAQASRCAPGDAQNSSPAPTGRHATLSAD